MRGLVLGGGGVTGIAWEVGVLAGLAEAGVDLTDADLLVGTSAGSVVGALVANDGAAGLPALYADQRREARAEITARFGPWQMARYAAAALLPGDDEAVAARLGRWTARAGLAASVDERRRVIRARLGARGWPEGRRLRVTACDAESGALRVFDGSDGVPLADAVAASCAVPLVWPSVPIEGRTYLDGGARSPTNADLARGCGVVVVLAPIARGLRPSQRLSRQIASLGADVRAAVLTPDAAARSAIGGDVLDPSRRAAAALAGHAQAASALDEVRAAWQ